MQKPKHSLRQCPTSILRCTVYLANIPCTQPKPRRVCVNGCRELAYYWYPKGSSTESPRWDKTEANAPSVSPYSLSDNLLKQKARPREWSRRYHPQTIESPWFHPSGCHLLIGSNQFKRNLSKRSLIRLRLSWILSWEFRGSPLKVLRNVVIARQMWISHLWAKKLKLDFNQISKSGLWSEKKTFQKIIRRAPIELPFNTVLKNNFSNNMCMVRASETNWLA